MSFFLFGALVVVGVALAAFGGWLLVTGRTLPGLLGRGLTQGDNLRLQRAPAVYFRAMGTFICAIALVDFYVAVLMGLSRNSTVIEMVIAAFLGGAVFVAFLASAAWMFVVAYKYKLVRWNKP
ncbi:MAG: hypothetical protein PVS2B1_14350 [Candidatus Dormibacteraceae bacterium]